KLSKQLATIRCDVALDAAPEELTMKSQDKEKLHELFMRFEFKSWLRQLSETGETEEETPAVQQKEKGHYAIIFTQKDFDAWLKKLENSELFAFDTETTSLSYMDAEIVGVSFAV